MKDPRLIQIEQVVSPFLEFCYSWLEWSTPEQPQPRVLSLAEL